MPHHPTRRQTLAAGAALAATALPLPSVHAQPADVDDADTDTAATPLNLLILGGTGFLGPHTIYAATQRGHTITMFNRGRTQPELHVDLLESIEDLQGDRDGDLASLGDTRQWDAVIDTSAYVPRIVDLSCTLLADRVRQYVLISTISVYGQRADINMDEDTPVEEMRDPTIESVNGITYGPLKALCEQRAEAIMPGRVTNIRPGLIVGPGDRTDRYTYWPARCDRGGDMLCPGTGDDFVQYIDVRDLAEWIVRCIEHNHTGVMHAITPRATRTIGSTVATSNAAADHAANPVWVDTDFLTERRVQPWQHMPAWIPPSLEGFEGVGQTSDARARAAGLTCRDEATTAANTLAWWRSLDDDRRAALRAGCPAELEASVLNAWATRDSP